MHRNLSAVVTEPKEFWIAVEMVFREKRAQLEALNKTLPREERLSTSLHAQAGKSYVQVNRWKTGEQDCPIRKFRELCELLQVMDSRDLAIAGVALIADSLDMRLEEASAPIPDKGSMLEEIADTHDELAAFFQAIAAGESLKVVRAKARRAKREIDEDVEKYRQERGTR